MAATRQVTSREAAFAVLRDVVTRLQARGRSTKSAGLKPAINWYAPDSDFDVEALGFPSFRAFLEAAASAGYVQLRVAANAPDVEVIVSQADAAEKHRSRIRADLWDAFVDWDPEVVRLYDKRDDVVHKMRSTSGFEDRLRFVPIRPITQDATLKWMSEFAESYSEPVRGQLADALTAPKPFAAFSMAVKRLRLFHEWNQQRLDRVVERIDEWRQSAGLQLEIFATSTERSGETSVSREEDAPERTSVPSSGMSIDALRTRIIDIISTMPPQDLLSLPLPIGFWLQTRE